MMPFRPYAPNFTQLDGRTMNEFSGHPSHQKQSVIIADLTRIKE
jgi:hypothetical protein